MWRKLAAQMDPMMHRISLTLLLLAISAASGCGLARHEFHFEDRPAGPHQAEATQIEYPDVQTTMNAERLATAAPRALENPRDQPARDLTLAEAVRLGVEQQHGDPQLGR